MTKAVAPASRIGRRPILSESGPKSPAHAEHHHIEAQRELDHSGRRVQDAGHRWNDRDNIHRQ